MPTVGKGPKRHRGKGRFIRLYKPVKLPEGSPAIPPWRVLDADPEPWVPPFEDFPMNTTDIACIVDEIDKQFAPKMGEVDSTQPQSIANLIPQALLNAIKACPVHHWESSGKELEKLVFGPEGPVPNMVRLKIAFWDEYDRCISQKLEKMHMPNVYTGNCTFPYLYKTLLNKPGFIAWLMQPPPTWTARLKGIAHVALLRMEEAVSIGIERDKDGVVDTNLLKLQKSILDSADNRLNGAIVQRIHQTQQSLHLHGKASPEVEEAANQKALESMTMDDINQKIALLERRSAQAQLPGVIDVDMLKEAKAVTMVTDGTSTNKNDSPGAGG